MSTKDRPNASGMVEATEQATTVSPAEYAEFIGQIQLLSIWLKEIQIQNHHGPHTPDKATISLNDEATWEPSPSGFLVSHCFTVNVGSSDEQLAEMKVTFGLEFESKAPMTDDVFQIFEEVNLPVNTWPYLREFVYTTMGRLGWSPFTLPALKKGVKRKPQSKAATSQPPTRSRKKTSRRKTE